MVLSLTLCGCYARIKKKRSTLFANARPYGSLLSCLPLRWAAAFFCSVVSNTIQSRHCPPALLLYGWIMGTQKITPAVVVCCLPVRVLYREIGPESNYLGRRCLSPLSTSFRRPAPLGGSNPPTKSLGTGGARRWKGVKKGSRHGRPVLCFCVVSFRRALLPLFP